MPSALSEGGRRLYSEDDSKRMRIICFLRDAGLSISSIGELFTEEHPEKIISILLDQQEKTLREEQAGIQKKLDIIDGFKHELRELEQFSVESIGDIAHIMKQKDKLTKMHWGMVWSCIPMTALQLLSFILWITKGLWWLFALWAFTATTWAIIVSVYYYRHAAYICPECHEVFKPSFKEMFFAYHTPKMRRLTCPKCGDKGLCVEVYDDGGKTK